MTIRTYLYLSGHLNSEVSGLDTWCPFQASLILAIGLMLLGIVLNPNHRWLAFFILLKFVGSILRSFKKIEVD